MDFTRFRLFVFSTNRDQSPLIRLGLDMCSPGKRQNLVSKSLSKYIPRFLQTEGQFFFDPTDHVEDLSERYPHFDEDRAGGVVHWPHLPFDKQEDESSDENEVDGDLS